jgi:hypothetical protein
MLSCRGRTEDLSGGGVTKSSGIDQTIHPPENAGKKDGLRGNSPRLQPEQSHEYSDGRESASLSTSLCGSRRIANHARRDDHVIAFFFEVILKRPELMGEMSFA